MTGAQLKALVSNVPVDAEVEIYGGDEYEPSYCVGGVVLKLHGSSSPYLLVGIDEPAEDWVLDSGYETSTIHTVVASVDPD